MTHRRRDYEAWNRQYAEGLQLFRFALALFRMQVMAGRYAVLEHPSRASSWALPEVAMLQREFPTVRFVTFDQCLLGLRTVCGNPVRKRTKFLSNWPRLSGSVFDRCCNLMTCNHVPVAHQWLQGAEGGVSRARAAQVYPQGFCAAMADLVQAERLLGPVQHGPLQGPAAAAAADSDVELPDVELDEAMRMNWLC